VWVARVGRAVVGPQRRHGECRPGRAHSRARPILESIMIGPGRRCVAIKRWPRMVKVEENGARKCIKHLRL